MTALLMLLLQCPDCEPCPAVVVAERIHAANPHLPAHEMEETDA